MIAAGLQNVQFWEASIPAGLRPTSTQNGGYVCVSVTKVVTKTGRNAPDVVRRTGTAPAMSAVIRRGAVRRAGRVGTALGLLITQRSRVQILPPLLVSAGQGPFPV